MKKYAKEALKKVEDKRHQWTYETHGQYNPNGVSNYFGKLKDEGGRVIVSIRENEDYDQLSSLINVSKHMSHPRDMKGLAKWAWERGLVPMDKEERDKWNKKKIVPLDIREVLS